MSLISRAFGGSVRFRSTLAGPLACLILAWLAVTPLNGVARAQGGRGLVYVENDIGHVEGANAILAYHRDNGRGKLRLIGIFPTRGTGVHPTAQLRVPDDLSVIGFDNIPESALCEPALSTIDQPIQQMGFQAVHMLLDLVAGRPLEATHLTLPTALVTRGSTSRPSRQTGWCTPRSPASVNRTSSAACSSSSRRRASSAAARSASYCPGGETREDAPPSSRSSADRPKICCRVVVRSARSLPRNETNQCITAVTRFLKPVM